MGEVRECGGCWSTSLVQLLDMGLQPLSEGRPGRRYPLRLMRCLNCMLVQLSYVVDQAEVFPPDHPYTTGNSGALRKHYAELALEIAGQLYTGDLVVDIGANDCTMLNYLHNRARTVAVEPTDQIAKRYPAVTGYQEFFTEDLAHRIRGEHGQAKAITACNVLAHVPDPHEFLDGVRDLLADDGLFITENHDVASIIDGLQIDTVYHEHLRYYSPATLSSLLEDHALHTERVIPVPTHGGSFRTYARKYQENFPSRAKSAATALRGMLWKIAHDQKQAVYGISASTRATPIVHYAGIASLLTLICEVPGSEKIGRSLPGTQLQIVDEARLWEDQPPYALLLNWHMKDIVVPKLRAAGYTGKFIVPLPEPKVLDA